MVKIFIDAGHGGKDSGAVGNGLKEKDLTLKIAKKIRSYMEKNDKGHSIKMSRVTDKTVSLNERSNMANTRGADYVLSVHINSGGGPAFGSLVYNGRLKKWAL